MKRSVKPAKYFSREEQARIVAAIGAAEKLTSGEIRVHLERRVDGDPQEAARRIFAKLGMTATRQRNGVLLLLILETRNLTILGDEGIDARVPEGYWSQVLELMLAEFRRDRFVEGLEAGLAEIGSRLAAFFPRTADDVNELPDSLSAGE